MRLGTARELPPDLSYGVALISTANRRQMEHAASVHVPQAVGSAVGTCSVASLRRVVVHRCRVSVPYALLGPGSSMVVALGDVAVA
jgi:hypothetical protein